MSQFIHVLLVAAFTGFAGASLVADTKVKVTYVSDPPGATLYEDGRAWGPMPVTLEYLVPGRFKTCEPLKPVLARWVSGAEAEAPPLRICPEHGKNQQVGFVRPSGVPNRELDVEFAIELLRLRIEDLAAKQRTQDQWLALYGALAAQTQRYQSTLRCTSRIVGYTVHTSCY